MKKRIIINNIETQYEVDENGIVYNINTEKELIGSIYNSGYRMVRLTINGKSKGFSIHRLVAQAFLENPNDLPIVNHKDGNKLNNRVDNLEWVTQSENRRHAITEIKTKLAYGKRKKADIKEDNIFWKKYKNSNYLISKDGQVYNTKTHILLKQTPNQSGYIRYTLRIDNKTCTKLAHVLVLETWLEEEFNERIVNHKDGNKTNNNIENLELISKSENAKHAIYQLQKIGKSVIEIIDEHNIKEYLSIMEAARSKQVTDSAIRYALKNNSKCCGHYWQYK